MRIKVKFQFLTDHPKTKLLFCSTQKDIDIEYHDNGSQKELNIDSFIDIKGWKALGNKLSEYKITKLKVQKKDQFKPGDTLEFD